MTLQRKATIVSSVVATILILIKLVASILSGSVALLASAIDSVLDLIVSLFNYFAVVNSEKPADREFNYGRGKIEALASVIEGTIIVISGLFIIYQSVDKLINKESINYLNEALWVMVISFFITLGLVKFLEYVAKKTNSMVIKADALHYKTDLLSNLAILISLAVVYFTGFEFVDAIMGFLIAIYIIHSAYKLIKDGVLVLLDISLDREIVDKIIESFNANNFVDSYHDLRTREAGKDRFVDVHLVFHKNISLLEAHDRADEIIANIKSLDDRVNWIINVHFDPFDDSVIK